MKRIVSALIPGCMLACSVVVSTSAAETKTAWNVAGDLEEACSCRLPCPCWFKLLPSRMTCDGVQAVFIQKGRYGKTSLDGLAMAQFVQSPEGKSMFESFGDWNFDNVYIDEKATEEQRQALKAIAEHLFPPAAKKRNFHFVSINRRVEGLEHKITVGSTGSFAGHLIEGGSAGHPKIMNVPLADPTHREYLQGEATKLSYGDSGQGWNYENSNYMFNRFKVDNRQYEKHEAEVAKKMAQANAKAEK